MASKYTHRCSPISVLRALFRLGKLQRYPPERPRQGGRRCVTISLGRQVILHNQSHKTYDVRTCVTFNGIFWTPSTLSACMPLCSTAARRTRSSGAWMRLARTSHDLPHSRVQTNTLARLGEPLNVPIVISSPESLYDVSHTHVSLQPLSSRQLGIDVYRVGVGEYAIPLASCPH